jgi:very-short-patch-repair endonuclease
MSVQASRGTERPPQPFESWFELDVALRIAGDSYRVTPQFECAGKRIDLVVEGTRSRLAVECDGDDHHGADEYQRDMERQRMLERAGWQFFRIRASQWYARSAAVMRDLERACTALGIRPIRPATAGTGAEAIHPIQVDGAARSGDSASGVRRPVVVIDIEPPEAEDEAGAKTAIPEPAPDEMAAGEAPAPDRAVSGPFSGYSADRGFPNPRTASQFDIRQALMTIVERDGPLPRHSLYRLYEDGCPQFARVTRSIRQHLDRAFNSLLRAGSIEQQDEHGEGNPDDMIVRITGSPPVCMRPLGQRTLNDIPPSELAELMATIDPLDRITKELLYRRVLDEYGLVRLTQNAQRVLARAYRIRSETRAGGHT